MQDLKDLKGARILASLFMPDGSARLLLEKAGQPAELTLRPESWNLTSPPDSLKSWIEKGLISIILKEPDKPASDATGGIICPDCGQPLDLVAEWSRTPQLGHADPFKSRCSYARIATNEELNRMKLRSPFRPVSNLAPDAPQGEKAITYDQ